MGGTKPLELPPLTAVVTDFAQEHLDPQHDPVEGMLGMVGSSPRVSQPRAEAIGGQ